MWRENPDAQSVDSLHERDFSLVAPLFERERLQAAARYRELAGTGRTSNRVTETVSAAIDGRVDVLFVAVGIRAWATETRRAVRSSDTRLRSR